VTIPCTTLSPRLNAPFSLYAIHRWGEPLRERLSKAR
jgi:hypothetical protein